MYTKTLYNHVKIPALIWGTFRMETQNLVPLVGAARSLSMAGFDTSPSYRTEGMIADAIQDCSLQNENISRKDFYLQTKIDSWQMIKAKGAIEPFVDYIVQHTKIEYLDALLIHWPYPDYFVATWKTMERLYESGIVRAIGLCNARQRHILRLEKSGANICPMIAQNEIHPLNTEKELVEFFEEKGIVVQAYSPLCQMVQEIRENADLKMLAKKYDCSIAQLILQWLIARGIIPIVKTQSVERLHENASSFDITIAPEDRKLIEMQNKRWKIFLESRCCPGF